MQGRQNTYEITQYLVLIKRRPLENFSGSFLDDDMIYLLNDIEGSRKAKRIRHLSGTPKMTGQGISFPPDNVQELKDHLQKLLSASTCWKRERLIRQNFQG